ncbi:hypothetical protein, partial [Klebsiella pneumoniae]|uniref:hypothetical protein n=1 Tax=Klebsiella pneumoniae TaxID=573 RepID=UPI00353209C9
VELVTWHDSWNGLFDLSNSFFCNEPIDLAPLSQGAYVHLTQFLEEPEALDPWHHFSQRAY